MMNTHHNDHFISGSPFYVEVEDSTRVLAIGKCLEASPIHKKAEFEIDPSLAPYRADAKIRIFGMPNIFFLLQIAYTKAIYMDSLHTSQLVTMGHSS